MWIRVSLVRPWKPSGCADFPRRPDQRHHGYEEAAAQGLLAGSTRPHGQARAGITFDRAEGYLAVMIDVW